MISQLLRSTHIVPAISVIIWILTNCKLILNSTIGPTIDPKSRVNMPIRTAAEIEEAMKFHHIIPDVISYAPKHMLWMEFIDDFSADLGNDLSGKDVLYPPWLIKWPVENGTYYSLLGTSPDTLSHTNHTGKEFMHWLVVNIKAEDVLDGRAILHGKIFAPYIGPDPPKGLGYYRYVFFIFKQKMGKTKYSIPELDDLRNNPFRIFNSSEFATKMHFGKAVAVNFFAVEWRVNPYRPFM